MHRVPSLALLVAMILCAPACALLDTSAPEEASNATPAPSPDTADPNTADPDTADPNTADPNTADPDTADPDTADPDTADSQQSEDEGEECTAETLQGVDETIGAQLDSFVARDFAAALAFGTPAFQSQFSPESFGQMITSGFPVAADATSHEVAACQTVGGAVRATVVVTADIGSQLLEYGLRSIGGVWLIDGAVPLGSAEGHVV